MITGRRLAGLAISILIVGSVAAQETSTHTVKTGDTLYGIARANGTSVEELRRLNGLTGDIIRIGQVLRIREGGGEGRQESPGQPDRETGDERDAGSGLERVSTTSRDSARGRDSATGLSDEAESAAGAGTAATVVGAPEPAVLEELAPDGLDTLFVQPGETLYGLAAELGTKAYILRALNGGVVATLEPGIPILVPKNRGEKAGGPAIFAVGTVTTMDDAVDGEETERDALYKSDEFFVAHRELPFDTVLIVENPETGRASFARVAARGPSDRRHLLGISHALASEIDVEPGQLVRIRIVE